MRPYLAIIKDSFREARASWVLWIVLILVTVTLLLLAPLGYRRIVDAQFRAEDCIDWVGLLNQVQATAEQDPVTPAAQIWNTFSAESRELIETFPRTQEKITREDRHKFREVVDAFDHLLDKPELYNAEAWPATSLGKEARTLLAEKESGNLVDNRLRRFNRLLLEAAFPRIVKQSPRENIMFVYGLADMNFAQQLPFTEKLVERLVKEMIVLWMSLIVSTIGVFIAILATASQIKRIFDEGSINLLLSKPINRSLLYLAKYVGGCIFILIMATYFIAGLSLIAGLRFGIWDWRPLACVPLFVLMFMTYFSLSGLASIIWKNTIISIGAPIVLFCICFLLGTAKQLLEVLHINQISFNQLTQAGDELVAITRGGVAMRWNAESRSWTEVFQPKNVSRNSGMMRAVLRTRLLGPVIDERDRMLAIRMVGTPQTMSASTPLLYYGRRFDNFAAERGPIVPAAPLGMYQNAEGKLLVVAAEGIYRLRGSVDKSQAPMKIGAFEIPFTGSSQPFEKLTTAGAVKADAPATAAFDQATGEIVIYSQGQLSSWRPTAEGKYEAGPTREILSQENRSAVLAVGGGSVLLVTEEGQLHLLDSQTLEPKQSPTTPHHETPKLALAAPNGMLLVVLYHTGYVYQIDPQTGDMSRAPLSGQGDITAMTFLENGELAAVDRAVRVTTYDLASGERTGRMSPALDTPSWFYYWIVEPLYYVFPKPGALDQTVRYVLTGEKTAPENEAADLNDQQLKLRPWSPIPSTAIFIVIMLALSCWLIERQEF